MRDQAGPGRAAPDVTLDEAIATVRDDVPEAGVAERAAARVWPRIAADGAAPLVGAALPAVEAIGGCADVLALLEARRRGELTPGRALLVDDHLRECVGCRGTLLRPGQRRLALLPWRPETRQPDESSRWRAYAVAASVVLAVAVSAAAVRQAFFDVPAGSRAAVQSLTGSLQRVGAGRALPLAPGEELGEAEPVRTGRGSRAVLRLRDGSLVEMSERAELAIAARGSDTTIRLARGNIIVRAAKRRSGHLRVASGDCTVSVTGTVFSVSHGLKGSRVSVLEGQVRVAAADGEQVVAPGEQWTTSEAVERLSLEEEIAWSGEVDRHLALLSELKVLRERWRGVRTPGLRYETRLLPLLPESAVVFASLPNYGETLAEAHRLFEERLQESGTLREWWAQVDPARHGGPSLAQVMEKVRSFSGFLGDEVVLAAVEDQRRHRDVPLLLAELRRPGLREFLQGELDGLQARHGSGPPVRIVDGAVAGDDAVTDAIVVLIRGNVMAVSISPAALGDVARRLEDGSPGLESTSFGARLTAAYGEGVGVLFAADLQRITARVHGQDARRDEAIRRAGVDGLRYLVLERKEAAERARSHAAVTFDGPPRGIPSWLAAPGPIGSLEFVSPGAEVAAAFLVKSPALILDDVVAMASAREETARQDLADLESKLDLHLREDFAETLGAEFAIALDGPLLPTPSWKVIVEVYDPARLQASLQTLVTRAGDQAQSAGRPALRLEAEQADGETYYALRGGLPFEVHYAYSGGYLVAAPSRALVMKAIQARAGGETLARSPRLQALFTPDRDVNVSAILYQNLAPLVGSLLQAPGAASLSAEQRRSVQALAGDARPTLLCAYGEPDGIRVAGLGGAFDLDTGDFALPLLIQRVFPGTARVAAP
jgi:ferric-dicitrate binding protein FerR (iron transport regulator)